MPTKKPDIRITFRIPADIHKKLKAEAKRQHISQQAYVIRLLEANLSDDKTAP